MARVFREEEYLAKRDEIVNVALGLVYSKGYEQMTIQDILDGLGISKGAFYHYFDSKQALLEAIVDRTGREAEQLVLPIVHDPDLSAIEKFRRYLEAGARWKSMQRPLIASLLRMWYTDENAAIRQKLSTESLKHTPRLIEPIIRQGIQEGVFDTRFPEQVALIVAGIDMTLSDTLIGLLLAPAPDETTYRKSQLIVEAYVETLERILCAPAGSLKTFEPDAFKEWFLSPQPEQSIELAKEGNKT